MVLGIGCLFIYKAAVLGRRTGWLWVLLTIGYGIMLDGMTPFRGLGAAFFALVAAYFTMFVANLICDPDLTKGKQ